MEFIHQDFDDMEDTLVKKFVKTLSLRPELPFVLAMSSFLSPQKV